MEKYKSILWMQDEDASKNGYLVINGEVVPNPDEKTYYVVNRKTLKDFSLNIMDEKIVDKYLNSSTNQYFRLGSGLFKGVAYRSCFLKKEKNDGEEPFLFWKPSLRLKGFIDDAISAAKALGKTLDEKELAFVDKYIKRIRSRRICFCILVVIIAILIIILINC